MKKIFLLLLLLPMTQARGQYLSPFALMDSTQFVRLAGPGRAVVWSVQVNAAMHQLQRSHTNRQDSNTCVLVVGFREADEAEAAAQGRAQQVAATLQRLMASSSRFRAIPVRVVGLPQLDRSDQPMGIELDATDVDYLTYGPGARVELCLAPPEAMQWDTARVAAHLQRLWQYQADRALGPTLIPMRRGQLMGYVDTTDAWVIEPQFEDAGLFIAGRAWATQQGKLGFIDPRGQWVIAPAYQSRIPHRIEYNNFDRLSHLVLLKKRDRLICLDAFGDTARWSMWYACGGAWGSNARGKLTGTAGQLGFEIYPGQDNPEPQEIPAEYEAIRTAPNCIFVQQKGQWGTYDWQGEPLLACRYDSLIHLHTHHYGQRRFFPHHIVQQDGLQGLVSETGQELLAPCYEQIVPYLDYARAKLPGGPWVYLQSDGKELRVE